MIAALVPRDTVQLSAPLVGDQSILPTPFFQELVVITKQELIELKHQAAYWRGQHAQIKRKFESQKAELVLKDAQIKDLQNRAFGKKSEKSNKRGSESNADASSGRSKGQQLGTRGHGRTPRPDLPVEDEILDLPEEEKKCATCGLPHRRCEALDETSDVIEVEVKAHIRRYHRSTYVPDPSCCCPGTPAVITAPPPPRLIPRSPYGVSFWVGVILSKFHYAQPTHRHLQDLRDQRLPVSPGTVAGGLQFLSHLFIPIFEALYCRQMGEKLFHNDETRWEVFVPMEGKVGTRWYLWVTRSASVVFYSLDPTRSAAVPGAHFAGLQVEKAIIVCDRYSAYKKLARLSDLILLAFCWAHVRRDFLDSGRSYDELEPWALSWKERIGSLYHLNRLRLEHWNPEISVKQQSKAFQERHRELALALESVHAEAKLLAEPDSKEKDAETKKSTKNGQVSQPSLSKMARQQQRKVAQSLLNHWDGLRLFLDSPEVPMDNNLGENSMRGPVVGRKNYYGSGSLWRLFGIFRGHNFFITKNHQDKLTRREIALFRLKFLHENHIFQQKKLFKLFYERRPRKIPKSQK